ncbi:hypothetical protein SUGI_0564940 [Cryptomeria japonica]|nr:hypothetical protein SUGI_0564940 [Cryptomeria japonica]
MEKNVSLPSNLWLLKKKRRASRVRVLMPEVYISAESLLNALIALAHKRTKYLLEDCSSDGSCVWFFLHTLEFSNQFYGLIHDMAFALDMLPLKLLDVSDEVREQVELLHHQAKRDKLFVGQAEEKLGRDVSAVLDEFEKEIAPNES